MSGDLDTIEQALNEVLKRKGGYERRCISEAVAALARVRAALEAEMPCHEEREHLAAMYHDAMARCDELLAALEAKDEALRVERAGREHAEKALHSVQFIAVTAQSPRHVTESDRLAMLKEIEDLARAALSQEGTQDAQG